MVITRKNERHTGSASVGVSQDKKSQPENSQAILFPDDSKDTLLSCKSRVSLDGVSTSTPSSRTESAPTIPSKSKQSYVQSGDHQFQYKNADLFKLIKPCSINIKDIFDYNDNEQHCMISKCRIKNCKTCNILITDTHFTSDLTH